MHAHTVHQYAAVPVDIFRVIHMLMIHDFVEIDAGDTFAFTDACCTQTSLDLIA
ncbi:HD domain-containing protein [Persicirhabdus sediminis]|uniref:HD domain-containing protein n=1 Tax=Persicirhabdus sediminis TaxID=454144 RepID=A0A8J7MGT7_9BACT|nr:HD domain-containing protein [Persicirhabdus sediminis]